MECPEAEPVECPEVEPVECPSCPEVEPVECPGCPEAEPVECPEAEPVECPEVEPVECPSCPEVEPVECPGCPEVKPAECPGCPACVECPKSSSMLGWLNGKKSDVDPACPEVLPPEPAECPVCADEPAVAVDYPLSVYQWTAPVNESAACPEVVPAAPTIIETFTSQQCPECPDADAFSLAATDCPTLVGMVKCLREECAYSVSAGCESISGFTERDLTLRPPPKCPPCSVVADEAVEKEADERFELEGASAADGQDDYALLSAGSSILYHYTSQTYVPSLLFTRPLWDLLVNKYHVEIGIVGRPEEALALHRGKDRASEAAVVGRCWAMEVGYWRHILLMPISLLMCIAKQFALLSHCCCRVRRVI